MCLLLVLRIWQLLCARTDSLYAEELQTEVAELQILQLDSITDSIPLRNTWISPAQLGAGEGSAGCLLIARGVSVGQTVQTICQSIVTAMSSQQQCSKQILGALASSDLLTGVPMLDITTPGDLIWDRVLLQTLSVQIDLKDLWENMGAREEAKSADIYNITFDVGQLAMSWLERFCFQLVLDCEQINQCQAWLVDTLATEHVSSKLPNSNHTLVSKSRPLTVEMLEPTLHSSYISVSQLDLVIMLPGVSRHNHRSISILPGMTLQEIVRASCSRICHSSSSLHLGAQSRTVGTNAQCWHACFGMLAQMAKDSEGIRPIAHLFSGTGNFYGKCPPSAAPNCHQGEGPSSRNFPLHTYVIKACKPLRFSVTKAYKLCSSMTSSHLMRTGRIMLPIWSSGSHWLTLKLEPCTLPVEKH